MQRPFVYLAGRIAKNDWRHSIVPNLRRYETKFYGIMDPIETDLFTYVGPFFIACDHGCYHGDHSHGSIGECGDSHLYRKDVKISCRRQIESCDLFFFHIEDDKCFGSLVELGWAEAANKRIIINLKKPQEDMWFAKEGHEYYIGNPVSNFKEIIQRR